MKPSPKLRINKADRQAAKQTGYPALFYTIQRTYGTDKAQIYLEVSRSPTTALSRKERKHDVI